MKMNHFYKNTNTIKYLLSYFLNRKQYVIINSTDSELINNHNISCVQGSTNGPLTYSLYCSDISNITKAFTVLFADDTNIILSGPNLHELQKLANETLITIMDYMSANKLTLNAKKTVALLFTPRNKPILPLSLKIGNTIIEQVNETKFLGVTIDDKLKFNTHFNNVTSKIKQGIGAKLNTYFPIKLKLKFIMV